MADKIYEIAIPPRKSWTIILLASLFYCYQFIVRVFPNVLHDDLMTLLQVDAHELGWIISTYGWAHSLMQIPLGMALDRYGTRWIISASCALCSLGCFAFAFTTNPMITTLGRFMMGLGSACGFLSCVKLATLWLPARHLAKSIAITMVFGTLGASLGGGPLCTLNMHWGVQNTLIFLGCIGVVITTILMSFIHNIHNVDRNVGKTVYSNTHPLRDLIAVVRHPQSWFIALFSMLMYAPITVLGEAWGVPYVNHSCHVTHLIASTVVTTMFVGAAIGSPLFTALSDILKSRKTPMVIGVILSILFNIGILVLQEPTLMTLKVLFFMVGLSYTAKVLTFSSICEIMPKKISGLSVAFVNTIVMSTGALFHPLIGKIVHFSATHETIAAQVAYKAYDYKMGLMVLPVGLILAFVIIILIRETYPGRSQKH